MESMDLASDHGVQAYRPYGEEFEPPQAFRGLVSPRLTGSGEMGITVTSV